MDLKRKKVFLFDIDGTLSVEDTLFEGVRELLESIKERQGKSYFITNNSTKSLKDYVEKFAKWKIPTTPNQFVTAGFTTMLYLKEHFLNELIFVLGTNSFLSELKANGLQVTEEIEPDVRCVLVGYDSELTYKKLEKVCELLSEKDLPYFATNPDLCCPARYGFVPDCGAICNMIFYATKKQPVFLGKPNPILVQLCLQDCSFSKEECIVVGDRLYTDIACGIAAGVSTCAVLTGETNEKEIAESDYKPDFCFKHIKELLEQYKKSV